MIFSAVIVLTWLCLVYLARATRVYVSSSLLYFIPFFSRYRLAFDRFLACFCSVLLISALVMMSPVSEIISLPLLVTVWGRVVNS